MKRSIQALVVLTAMIATPSVTLAQGAKGLSGVQRTQTARAQTELRRAIKPWQSCFQNATKARSRINTCRGKFRSYKTKATSVAGKNPAANVSVLLMQVFREAISQTSSDKKYFLNKVKQQNDLAEELSDYLKELAEASSALSRKKGRTQAARINNLLKAERRRTISSITSLCGKAGAKRCPRK